MDSFAVIADPTRRRILNHLCSNERDVGELVDLLHIAQPLASKHLRVLRDAGTVTAAVVGKRRVYRLAANPLPEVLAWVTPYYRMWTRSLDRLEDVLDKEEV